MTITTKKGDKGRSYWGGRVVDKDSKLLETVGSVDELMAVVGVAMVHLKDKEKKLRMINSVLFSISGYLAGFGGKVDLKEKIKMMEEEIEKVEKKQGLVEKFLEVGEGLELWLNWTRTVARRAERRVVSLSKKRKLDKDMLVYFNRLSDYLFTLARKAE